MARIDSSSQSNRRYTHYIDNGSRSLQGYRDCCSSSEHFYRHTVLAGILIHCSQLSSSYTDTGCDWRMAFPGRCNVMLRCTGNMRLCCTEALSIPIQCRTRICTLIHESAGFLCHCRMTPSFDCSMGATGIYYQCSRPSIGHKYMMIPTRLAALCCCRNSGAFVHSTDPSRTDCH